TPTFSATCTSWSFATARNLARSIGKASPPVSRCAFAASPARRTIAKTTSAVRIGTRVPPRSQAGGPRQAIRAVRRGSLQAARHNADAHVTSWQIQLAVVGGDAKLDVSKVPAHVTRSSVSGGKTWEACFLPSHQMHSTPDPL